MHQRDSQAASLQIQNAPITANVSSFESHNATLELSRIMVLN